MNQPDRNKQKFTYFEHKEVMETLQQMAKEETEAPGHIVTVPERLGEPHEFAALAAFLVSERASYITGTSMQVDGGWIRSLL